MFVAEAHDQEALCPSTSPTPLPASTAHPGFRLAGKGAAPDRLGKLEAPGLRPTTDIGDLLDCELVISMLPDDAAVREIVFGRKEIGLDGLAEGLMPGAIHLSMSTISSAAASLPAPRPMSSAANRYWTFLANGLL